MRIIKLICLLLVFVVVFLGLTGCNKEASWNYDDTEFANEYVPYFENKLISIKESCGIECSFESYFVESTESEYKINLYNDEFTMLICISNDFKHNLGELDLKLIFYGSEEHPIDSYESQEGLVDFANEIIAEFCAFKDEEGSDEYFYKIHRFCIKNQFDRILYKQYVNDLEKFQTYTVYINNTTMSSYYKMQGNVGITIPANAFAFEGFLKELP